MASSKPTIAVLGHTGMLGGYITTHFKKEEYDVALANPFDAATATTEELRELVSGLRGPAVVINCIGIIKQRPGITDEQFMAVNAEFPRRLQEATAAAGARLIHISTDCVFSGKHGLYTERHTPDPVDEYSRSKLSGEPAGATVVRTSCIGSERKQKLSLLEWVKAQAGKEVGGYTNHFWNGVTCLQLAVFLEQQVAQDALWEGVRHYHSPQDVSKYELVRMMSDAYGLRVAVQPVEAPVAVNRTLRSVQPLPPPPGLEEQLRKLHEFDKLSGLC